MNIDKENVIVNEIRRRLSTYPRLIIIADLVNDMKVFLTNHKVKMENMETSVYIQDIARKIVESTEMYKMNGWGNYTLIIATQEKKEEKKKETKKPFEYTPKTTMADLMKEMEKHPDPNTVPMQHTMIEEVKEPTIVELITASINEPEEQEETIDEDDGTFNGDDPLFSPMDDYDEDQTIIHHNNKVPMYLIDLVQFAIDNQPKSTRGASFLIDRDDHNGLLTDLMKLYRGHTEDPEPPDVTAAVKLWVDECIVKVKDDLLKSQYRTFAKAIVRFYYDTYTQANEELRNMLDSI